MNDNQIIIDSVQQLLGELKMREHELEGKPVPPGIQRGVERFRAKRGGTCLVPPLDDFDMVLSEFNADAAERRKELAAACKKEFDAVMAFVGVLRTHGIFPPKAEQK